ncbi:MAG TPA: hypothetical protein VHR41_04335 [Gemmatimonadales bacterium]|nr:hypothetical protein [Gemmatimonadales bacterium]
MPGALPGVDSLRAGHPPPPQRALPCAAFRSTLRASCWRFPTISERQFTGGGATVTVTGSSKISQEIPLNTKASYGDGESTWLQFGVSGSAEGDVLVTYGESKEIGITVGRGKFLATGGIMPGEKSQCSGKAQVTAALVSGDYTCTGVTSKQAEGGMGKVDIKVTFTAKS